MKRFLLFLFGFFILSTSYSQDPELFKTWYVHSIYLEGHQDPYNMGDIEPSISPTLTITEDFQYSGEGACNTFSGQYSINYGDLSIDSFIPTTDTCDFQSHTEFENHYFEFFIEGMELQIGFISETQLTLNSLLFTSMHLFSYPLGISENTISEVKLYPNPAPDELFISLEKDKVEKIMISSISGKKVMEVINIENPIDVSSLTKGMYFLEIISSEGREVKKFVKN